MAHVFPAWAGKLLLTPWRRIIENPKTMLGPHVAEGMTVLEPGPGMGFFTLPLARMVGENGRIVALDVQQPMLDGLERRARKAGLWERIDARMVDGDDTASWKLEADVVDFATAIHIVHETPDQNAFFRALASVLKPEHLLLVVEPGWHVTREAFMASVDTALAAGFTTENMRPDGKARSALLRLG